VSEDGRSRPDEIEFERIAAAADKPWHERVTLSRDALGQLSDVQETPPQASETPPHSEPAEPQEILSVGDRLRAIEEFLGPAAVAAGREQQLAQWQALVEQVNEAPPEVLAEGAAMALESRVMEKLGGPPAQVPPTQQLEQNVAVAENLAAQALGSREAWDELAPLVAEYMSSNPDVFDPQVQTSDPMTLAQTFVGVANLIRTAESAQSAQSEAKRQAATMGAGSLNPNRQLDPDSDEAYFQRILAAARETKYGS
jgi:hypothetical protein